MYAHSKDVERGINSPQTYRQHVRNVTIGADRRIKEALLSTDPNKASSIATVNRAASIHDLGKLPPPNQHVLSGDKTLGKLPIGHIGAGVSLCLKQKDPISAILVQSHHHNLPNLIDGYLVPQAENGQPDWMEDADFESLLKIHNQHAETFSTEQIKWQSEFSPFHFRLMLSCLVDADHFDTAEFYSHFRPSPPRFECKWENRLENLKKHVKKLSDDFYLKTDSTAFEQERQKIRDLNFAECLATPIDRGFQYLSSPPGTGKTHAAMAAALQIAKAHNLRHIIHVNPLTSLIDQAVKAYQVLKLPGDDKHVVEAIHHKIDFGNKWSRLYSQTFTAPIVVTTAVNFFESLAGSSLTSLRKIHQIPQSVIIIDEAHMTLPIHLWKLAWYWLKVLVEQYGCYVILSSGTQTKFWETGITEDHDKVVVTPLIDETKLLRMQELEEKRVKIVSLPVAFTLNNMARQIRDTAKGPTVIVCNTILSAVSLSEALTRQAPNETVLHISNVLTPLDRLHRLLLVKYFLADCKANPGKRFFVVATSVVETGWDVSFQTGFRERGSFLSTFQLAGRVNRNFELETATVYDFQLVQVKGVTSINPEQVSEIAITTEMFRLGRVSLKYCDEYLNRLYRLINATNIQAIFRALRLRSAERKRQFNEVANNFKVILASQRTYIVDPTIVTKIREHVYNNGPRVNIVDIIEASVRISNEKIDNLGLEPFTEPLFPDTLDNRLWDNLFILHPNCYDDKYGFYKGMFIANVMPALVV